MRERQEKWVALYKEAAVPIEAAYIITAFGCNLQGEVPLPDTVHAARHIVTMSREHGFPLPRIMLADTVGWANPEDIKQRVGAIRELDSNIRIGLHLHDTRGMGAANVYAALEMGVDMFDSSVAGLGGCPFAAHANVHGAGNVCTEDMVYMCEEMGIETGIDVDALIDAAHIAERVIGEYVPIMRKSTVNFVENPETVFENLREVRPSLFFAVPRVWEKVYSQVAIGLSEADKMQQAAYAWAVGVGREVAQCTLDGRAPSGSLKLRYKLAQWLVLNNVKRMIGMDRVEVGLTGAAPISPDLIRWFLALGIPLREGWGMTETCGGGTTTPRDGLRPGSIGLPGPGLEMRIAEGSNEIMLRGPNVILGYLNQPEKTAETIDADGWLHTGDVGHVDDDGYFYITDRMKDIIITAGGKNITPSELENDLKFSPYITDAVVIGDKRPYLVVIVMIDQENVEKFAQDRDIPFSNYASLTQAKEVQDLIWAEIERVNKKFARVEQIKKFYLLQNQLTAEDDELTPTMKLKRKLVEKKYAQAIEAMYR
jgi:hypothetical protein